MLLPHGVEAVSDGGVLAAAHGKFKHRREKVSSVLRCAFELITQLDVVLTHHPDGEVVVYDRVRHGISLLRGVVWDDLNGPAVHRRHRAAPYVLQDVA